jgi:hypothetical protein
MIDTTLLHIGSVRRQHPSQPGNSPQGPASGPPPPPTEAHAFLKIGRSVELMNRLGKLAYTRNISIDGSAGS